MNKLLVTISAGIAYETFATSLLVACPLPRDQICATSPKDCREDQHIERDITANSSGTAVGIVLMSTGGPIMPGSGALTLTTPQQYIATPQPFISRPSV